MGGCVVLVNFLSVGGWKGTDEICDYVECGEELVGGEVEERPVSGSCTGTIDRKYRDDRGISVEQICSTGKKEDLVDWSWRKGKIDS